MVWVGFALNIAAFILTFFVVESPVWLVSVNRKQEAIEKLRYIAKINGRKDFSVTALRDSKFETVDPEKEKKAAE